VLHFRTPRAHPLLLFPRDRGSGCTPLDVNLSPLVGRCAYSMFPITVRTRSKYGEPIFPPPSVSSRSLRPTLGMGLSPHSLQPRNELMNEYSTTCPQPPALVSPQGKPSLPSVVARFVTKKSKNRGGKRAFFCVVRLFSQTTVPVLSGPSLLPAVPT